MITMPSVMRKDEFSLAKVAEATHHRSRDNIFPFENFGVERLPNIGHLLFIEIFHWDTRRWFALFRSFCSFKQIHGRITVRTCCLANRFARIPVCLALV